MAKVAEFNNLFQDKRWSDAYVVDGRTPIICSGAVKKSMGYLPESLTVRIYNKNPKRKHQVKIVRDDACRTCFHYQRKQGRAFRDLRLKLCRHKVSWIVLIDENK